MAEIDAGYPVIIHTYGHMMTGVGYDQATQTVYLHNTWDNTLASMTWGGTYASKSMRMVSVIHLEPPDATYDWGDAPDPGYPTLAASGGAKHLRVPTGPFLGTVPDAESDGQLNDDLDGHDDEDGVRFMTPLAAGAAASVNVIASDPGFLNAWLDFNDDGDWTDPGEQILTDAVVTVGANALSFSVPSTATATGETFARFRLSTATGLGPGGTAPDGEVEDYAVSISDQLGTIEGTQWLDLDADGVHDAEEPGLAGVQIFLDANDNGAYDSGERITTTGSDGSYCFTGVAPGVQIVREVVSAGATQTYPGPDAGSYIGTAYRSGTGSVEVTRVDAATGQVTRSGVLLNVLLQGMVVTNDGRIFGLNVDNDNLYEVDPQTLQVNLVGRTRCHLHQAMAYDRQTDTIYGIGRTVTGGRRFLFIYDRETGVPIPLDDGSSIVAGIHAAAWDEANQRMIGFDDDVDKFYAFDSAGVATYLSTSAIAIKGRSMAHNGTSVVMQPTGADGNTTLAFFDPDTGTEVAPRLVMSEAAAMESLEFLPGTPYGHRVYVEAGETESGLDFGVDAPGTGEIRGTKWHDLNENDAQDPDEPGLEGWTVFLDTNNNGLFDVGELSAVTDANGDYLFAGLPQGAQYRVVEMAQPGWYQTSPEIPLEAPAQAIALEANDLVFDPYRNILYGTANGHVLRYDLRAQTLLSPLTVGNQEIFGADITPDGQYLYVAGGVDAECQIAKIHLDTGIVTPIPYTPQSAEGRPWDIVVTSAGYAIFTTRFGSSGWNPLRHVSLTDDSVVVVDAELGSANGMVRQDTRLVRSEDYDVVYFAEANISSGPTFVYDAFADKYVGQRNLNSFVTGLPIALDRDGELAAVNTNAAQIYDSALLPVHANLGSPLWDGGIAFDPVRDRFYYVDEDADCIRAYDSNTWIELFQRTGFSDGSIDVYQNWNTGLFAFSTDGRFLFVSDDGHVDAFRMFASHQVTVTAGTTADLDFGSRYNDFHVMETVPPEGSYLVRHSFTIDVRLNEDVDAATVIPADARVGALPATSVSVTDNKISFLFTDVPNAAYEFVIEAGAIRSVAGEPVASFSQPIIVLADDAVGFTSGTLLVVDFPADGEDQISEYTLEGALVQNIAIAHGGDSLMRDIVVSDDRRIQGFAGTANPVLMTMQVAMETSEDHSFAGWSAFPSASNGGIAALREFVFVTDMGNSSDPDGIVRFDTSDFSATRFGVGDDYIDLTVGHDGLLYALENVTVHVYDPYSLAELKTLALNVVPGYRALAVDYRGHLFCAAWNGTVDHIDPSGNVVNSLATGTNNLFDIDLRPDGTIALTSRLGTVLVTNTALASVASSFSVPIADVNKPFVAFSAPLEFSTPGLTVTVVEEQIAETGGSSLVTVTRNTDPTSDLIVSLSADPTGESTIPASVIIPAGHVSATFILTAVDDTVHDGDSTVTVTAAADGHAGGGDSIDILDNDPQVFVTLNALPTSVQENGGVATITATLSAAVSVPVTVDLALGGTATPVDDYTLSSTQIVIPPLSLTGSVTLSALDDADPEPSETVLVEILSVTNAVESGEQDVTIVITDNDGTIRLFGSDSNDTACVWPGTPGGTFHRVSVNGTVTTYDPVVYDAICIDALTGNDTITVYGTDGSESATLRPGSVDVSGPGYTIHAVNVETITVDAGLGNDQVTMAGSTASNRLYSYADYSRLTDSTRSFSHRVEGFETLTVDVSGGSTDSAYLYDTPDDDELTAEPGLATFTRSAGSTAETTTTAIGFQQVYTYATEGEDTAAWTASDATQNRFYGYADYALFTEARRSFYFYARGFDDVTATSPASL
ncbi:MAG: hypothetical protein GXX96_16215, partial [Planctomycetaceae bacterium]|nr:hypothetical protein [Planctomycetaceae bacterium]